MPLPKDNDGRRGSQRRSTREDDQPRAGQQRCSHCRSEHLTRTHTHWYQRPRRWLTGQVPYRCRGCGGRVWGARQHSSAYSAGRRHRSRSQAGAGLAVVFGITAVIAVLIGVPLLFRSELSSAATTLSRGSGTDISLNAGGGAQPSTLVALISSRAYLDPYSTSWNIEGEMRNLGRDPLNNLHVVSTWFDARGTAVASHTDLVDFISVGPGQTSTFRATTPVRPEMVTFRLEFRSDVGTLLLTQDGSLPPERAVATSGTTPR